MCKLGFKLNKYICFIWLILIYSCTQGADSGYNSAGTDKYITSNKNIGVNSVSITDNADPTVVVTGVLSTEYYSCSGVTGLLVSATVPFGTDITNLTPTWHTSPGVRVKQLSSPCLAYTLTNSEGLSQNYFIQPNLAPISMAALRLISNAIVVNVSKGAGASAPSSTGIVNVSKALADGYGSIVESSRQINIQVNGTGSQINKYLGLLYQATSAVDVALTTENLNTELSLLEEQKSQLLNLINEAQINYSLAQTQYNFLTGLPAKQALAGKYSVKDLIGEIYDVLNKTPTLNSIITYNNQNINNINKLQASTISAINQAPGNVGGVNGTLNTNQISPIDLFIGSYTGANPPGSSVWCGALKQVAPSGNFSGYQYPSLTVQNAGTLLVYQINQYQNSSLNSSPSNTTSYDIIPPVQVLFNEQDNITGSLSTDSSRLFTATFGYDSSTSVLNLSSPVGIVVSPGVLTSVNGITVDNSSTYTTTNCSINKQAMKFLNGYSNVTNSSPLALALSQVNAAAQLTSQGAGFREFEKNILANAAGPSGLTAADYNFLNSNDNYFTSAWQLAETYITSTSQASYNAATSQSAYWKGFEEGKIAQYTADLGKTSALLNTITGTSNAAAPVPAAGFGLNTPFYIGASSAQSNACVNVSFATPKLGYYLNISHTGAKTSTVDNALHVITIIGLQAAQNAVHCKISMNGQDTQLFNAPNNVVNVAANSGTYAFNNSSVVLNVPQAQDSTLNYQANTLSLKANLNSYYLTQKAQNVYLGVTLNLLLGVCNTSLNNFN